VEPIIAVSAVKAMRLWSPKEYEKQIDQMVYKLYGLTEEEINIVEDKN